jgi:hypothetical protein
MLYSSMNSGDFDSRAPAKTIAVIGHLVRDRIIRYDGEITEALGGIAYSLAASATAIGNLARIYPVCNVGYDMYDEVASTFGAFPAIDLTAIRVINRINKIHELSYQSEGYRRELNIGLLPTIKPFLFRKLPRIDIAWLNYIGGDEFPPEHIRWLKARYRPLLYMDYHSLSLGKRIIGGKPVRATRHFRYNPHWREYVALADIVQMNHAELRSLFPGMGDSTEAIIDRARLVQKAGPRIVIITRENREVVVIEQEMAKSTAHILEVKPVKVVDPTGCGDSLGAGFIAAYMQNRDTVVACKNGLAIAGRKAGFSGLQGFTRFK